jgi:hypothetical protein
MTHSTIQGAFWAAPTAWPDIEPPGFVFLGRAVQQAGAAVHGDAWAADDPAAEVIELPPPMPRCDRSALLSEFLRPILAAPETEEHRAINARLDRQRRELMAMRIYKSKLAASNHPHPGKPPPEPEIIIARQWEIWAAAEAERQNELAKPKIDRANSVFRAVAWAAASGELQTVVRPTTEHAEMWCRTHHWDLAAPGLWLIPPLRWSSPHWRQRFAACQINVQRQDEDREASGEPSTWAQIYVGASSLAALVARITPADQRRAPWWPSDGDGKLRWAMSDRAQAEARARIERDGDNPAQQVSWDTALAEMWSEATDEPCNVGSMASLLRQDRSETRKSEKSR